MRLGSITFLTYVHIPEQVLLKTIDSIHLSSCNCGNKLSRLVTISVFQRGYTSTFRDIGRPSILNIVLKAELLLESKHLKQRGTIFVLIVTISSS